MLCFIMQVQEVETSLNPQALSNCHPKTQVSHTIHIFSHLRFSYNLFTEIFAKHLYEEM